MEEWISVVVVLSGMREREIAHDAAGDSSIVTWLADVPCEGEDFIQRYN